MRVFVTGSSRGIGKSIADLFKREGHSVYAPTRMELDLSKDFKLDNAEYDIVINNAGVNILSDIETLSDQNILKINYLSPLKIVQQCLPYMKKTQYGRFVNIGSIWNTQSKSLRHAYSASKSALHELTKSITSEYAKFNILANTVSPGFVETEMTTKNNSTDQIKTIIDETPVKRLGKPEEIAKLVYFLTVSNTFLTGQNIIVDGGYTCTRI